MEKVNLSISDVLNQSWEFAKKNAVMLVVLFLAMCGINFLLSMCVSVDTTDYVEAAASRDANRMINAWFAMYSGVFLNPLYYLSTIATLCLTLGFYKMILNVANGVDYTMSVSAFKMQPMTYVKAVALLVVMYIAVYVGLCFCLAPGIFLGVKLAFAPIYQMENPKAGIGESLSASWNMTSGNFWALFGMAIVAALVALAGIFLCCVGIFFTAPLSNVMFIFTYLAIKKNL